MIPLVLKGKVLSYIPYKELVELDVDIVSCALPFLTDYQELYKITVMRNRPKTLELLIKKECKIDYNKKDFINKMNGFNFINKKDFFNKMNGFNYASDKGYIKIVLLLLSLSEGYKIDPSAQDNHAIKHASSNGYIEIVKLLLSLPKSYGIDPSAGNNCAIRYASDQGRVEIVKLLLELPSEYGIDASVDDNYATRWALQLDHYEIVELLEEHINKNKN